MFYIKQLYIIISLSICFFINAQTLKFDSYTTKNGLVSDEVYNLHQDKKGYIWLFTNYGAMTFNGKIFEPTLRNLPFTESFIYCIYENEKGQKWIANSNAKIYEIINDSAFIVEGTETISEDLKKDISEIYQIYVDDSLNIFISTKHFSYKFCKNKNYKTEKLQEQIKNDSVLFQALELKHSIITVFNYPGFDIPDFIKKNSFINIQHISKNNTIKTYNVKCGLLCGPKYFKRFFSDIYFSFYTKMVRIDKRGNIKETPLNSFILNFTKDKNNHLWVACYNNGLFELDENDSIINHYFKNKTVNDVLVDSQDGLWVSTEGSGLYHCKNVNEFHYNEDKAFGSSIGFIKKINNQLFIANKKGAVCILENGRMNVIHHENLSFGEPTGIIQFNNKYIISFKIHIKTIEINKRQLKTVNDNKKTYYAYNLLNLGKDSLLYVQRKGVLLIFKNKVIEKKLTDFKTYYSELRDKIILIATDHGVFQFINNEFVRPSYLLATKNCAVTKIVKDKFDNFWFCSKGSGLFKLSPNNELKQYTISNDLPSNIVYDINFNDDNSILLSTNYGLFYNSGLEENKLKIWNELYAEEVKSALTYNHNIYLATNEGMVTINESVIKSNKPIYFNVTSTLVNGIKTNRNELRHLSFDKNTIEFNVDIISFSSRIPKIKYELTGALNVGGITSTQHVIFQNLVVGDYTLTLSLLSKINSLKPIVIEFTIIPAYWQTLWFKGFCLIFIFLICFLITWRVFVYLKNKEDKKNEANKLITEYKLIALKAQINPHFMSNCLTAIQHLILSNKVNEANQYIAKFSLLVRQVLNFSTKTLVTLNEELEITELNIELEQLRFDNKFTFEIELQEEVNLKTIFIPPLLLQPITENAI